MKHVRASDQMPITPLQRPQFPLEQVTIDKIGPIETPSGRNTNMCYA